MLYSWLRGCRACLAFSKKLRVSGMYQTPQSYLPPSLPAPVVFVQERVSGKDGRRRFDPDGNNPWGYLNVLLYTQQFNAAVSFLHWKGLHLQVQG